EGRAHARGRLPVPARRPGEPDARRRGAVEVRAERVARARRRRGGRAQGRGARARGAPRREGPDRRRRRRGRRVTVSETTGVVEAVRDWVDQEVVPVASEYEHADEFPEALVAQMRELGLFGVTIPEEYGGLGLGLDTYALIVIELSRGWTSLSGI